MNPETIKNSIQAVVDGLTPLAQKLGIALTSVFGWAMKHNFAIAWENVFGAVCGLVGIGIGTYALRKAYNMKGYNDPTTLWTTLGFIICAVSVAILVICSISAIDRFVAPEWHTAQDISCLVKNCNASN